MTVPDEPLEALGRLGQRYCVERVLGSGGFAEVLLARDEWTDDLVAVKRPLVPSQRATDMLRSEASVMGRCAHPNILGLRRLEEQGPEVYLVLEWAERGSVLDEARLTGRLSVQQIAAWGIQVLEGLGAMHSRGLVHRDVKPANILVATDGRALLCDFGVTLVQGCKPQRPCSMVGSRTYMAPEQAVSPDEVGPAADIYGLGKTLVRLWSRYPSVLVDPDDINRIVEITWRATRARPKDRYCCAAAMAEPLAALAERAAQAA